MMIGDEALEPVGWNLVWRSS